MGLACHGARAKDLGVFCRWCTLIPYSVSVTILGRNRRCFHNYENIPHCSRQPRHEAARHMQMLIHTLLLPLPPPTCMSCMAALRSSAALTRSSLLRGQ